MTELLLELCVDGLDFESEVEMDRIGERFSEWSWSSIDGQVIVGVSGDFDPVQEAERVARDLHAVFPAFRVTRWYEDYVSYSEIASRAGVSREAVRLWATGQRGPQDFPAPIGFVGFGDRRSPLWTWSVVAEWLAENNIFEDMYAYPSPRQVAEINWVLAKLLDRGEIVV